MDTKRSRHSKPLSLNEIIDELEKLDDDSPFPRNVTIFPPDNANFELTDEDSGDEEIVTLSNLPGTQLRAPAEIECMSSDSDDDDVPLSFLAKRGRITEEHIAEQRESELPPPNLTTTAIPFVGPKVSNKDKYTWRNRHNPCGQL
ncbi:piggyBac transposable element-derived protein 3-like [Eurosta solidaginis]|uniref:piggyBac transposable element-derived protein 3-like n=1 Tax=Eurosta solidaginis TaxID=178769 RepID=UPI003530E00C